MTVSPPDNLDLIRRVLGANLLELGLGHLSVDEQPDGETRVKVGVIEGGKAYDVEGQGVGLVHAVYNALLDRFAIEHLRMAGSL